MTGSRPLAGMRVLVTRAAHQADQLCAKLEALGAQALEVPVLEIKPPDDTSALDSALARIASFDWVVFASANAVRFCLQRAQKLGVAFAGPSFAAIGPATALALSEFGLSCAYRPQTFVAESFISEFPAFPALSGKRIFWPKASIGRMLIADELRAAGAEVEVAVCYASDLPEDKEATAERLVQALNQLQAGAGAVVLASSQTASNFRCLLELVLPPPEVSGLLSCLQAVCIGPQTAKTARECGFAVTRQAELFTMDGVIEQLVLLKQELQGPHAD